MSVSEEEEACSSCLGWGCGRVQALGQERPAFRVGVGGVPGSGGQAPGGGDTLQVQHLTWAPPVIATLLPFYPL